MPQVQTTPKRSVGPNNHRFESDHLEEKSLLELAKNFGVQFESHVKVSQVTDRSLHAYKVRTGTKMNKMEYFFINDMTGN